jgi:diguanylate cyclase (GGDEF)-like protein
VRTTPLEMLIAEIAIAAACAAALGFVVGVLAARRAEGRRFEAALGRVDFELALVAERLRRAADRTGERGAQRANDQPLAPNLERLLERIAAEGAPVHAFRRLASELRGKLADAHRLPRAKRPATPDELTGVRDRNGYEAELEREIARARRSGEPLALVLLDLGDLAERRVRSGHADVDRLLQDFAALLVGTTRVTDTVCRRGRGEFGVLLPGTDATGARHFRKRLRAGAARADFGRLGPMTFSSGIVEWRPGESSDVLDARARIAVGRRHSQTREPERAEGDDLLGEPRIG